VRLAYHTNDGGFTRSVLIRCNTHSFQLATRAINWSGRRFRID
jgi:hypothetical protein